MTARRGTRGLVWRLYAIGLVQFLLVVLCAVVIGYALTRLPARSEMQTLSARLKPVVSDPKLLARELRELRVSQQLMVSLYDESGRLVASNVAPALRAPRFGGKWPGPPPDDEQSPRRGDGPAPDGPLPDGPPPDGPSAFRHPPVQFGDPLRGRRPPPPDTFGRFAINGQEYLLIARFVPRRPSSWPLILTVISGLLVFGVGALLTARWIARPLSHLSRMAISLGQGNFLARSELTRKDEVGEVARAFDEMAERVQQLLRTEKELLANVAHELRTPLSRIRVALEIASEGDAQTARASLAEIAVDLAELETLINDVLSAARFELSSGVASNSGFALHLQEISPQTIGKRAIALFRSRHSSRPLSEHLGTGTRVLDADPVLLRRVLDNLLENADKYSPDSDTEISLTISEHNEQAWFEVRDHGMGIAKDDLPRIFAAFFRSERSRSRGTGGVGLGLTLAQRIVEAHGGRIEVESVLGTGTTFRAILPVRPSSGAPSAS
jgi:two-component system, OmpR family, sensor kinase